MLIFQLRRNGIRIEHIYFEQYLKFIYPAQTFPVEYLRTETYAKSLNFKAPNRGIF